MSESTLIEWTDATWPVTSGCDDYGPGCLFCYAKGGSHRLAHNPNPKVSAAYDGTTERRDGVIRWTGLVRPLPERLDWPFRWRKPKRIFVGNMSDLFHEAIPDEFIVRVFDVMRACTWAGGRDCGRIGGDGHTFQVLTKRAERMADFCSRLRWDGDRSVLESGGRLPALTSLNRDIWLGVSVENRKVADERIPHLLRSPACVRFLSVEPMLGPIDLRLAERPGIHWVIGGFESGPGARPGHPDWARRLRDDCLAAGVAWFWKQNGEWLADGQAMPCPVDAIGGKRPHASRALFPDGSHLPDLTGRGTNGDGAIVVRKVGKSRAGRLLDGREWSQFPESVAHVATDS